MDASVPNYIPSLHDSWGRSQMSKINEDLAEMKKKLKEYIDKGRAIAYSWLERRTRDSR